MNPKRKLIPKILSWEKTIESRRYVMKIAPRNKIHIDDVVYFKDAGKDVVAKAEVKRVLQFDHYSDSQLENILKEYGGVWWIAFSSLSEARERAKSKKYCVLIFLKNVQSIVSFSIDKAWYGNACAWISLSDIEKIRI